MSGFLENLFLKCRLELRNARIFCQGNEKVGLSFAPGCLTKMLIWVGICRAFGTKTLMLVSDLRLGSERNSTFENQCAECFGHGNGKVSLSTSHIHRSQSGVLTQYYDVSNMFLYETHVSF